MAERKSDRRSERMASKTANDDFTINYKHVAVNSDNLSSNNEYDDHCLIDKNKIYYMWETEHVIKLLFPPLPSGDNKLVEKERAKRRRYKEAIKLKDTLMLDSKHKSLGKREICDGIIVVDKMDNFELIVTNYYKNKGFSYSERSVSGGIQHAWSSAESLYITISYYDSKNKVMVQPGNRLESNMLQFVKDFKEIKAILVPNKQIHQEQNDQIHTANDHLQNVDCIESNDESDWFSMDEFNDYDGDDNLDDTVISLSSQTGVKVKSRKPMKPHSSPSRKCSNAKQDHQNLGKVYDTIHMLETKIESILVEKNNNNTDNADLVPKVEELFLNFTKSFEKQLNDNLKTIKEDFKKMLATEMNALRIDLSEKTLHIEESALATINPTVDACTDNATATPNILQSTMSHADIPYQMDTSVESSSENTSTMIATDIPIDLSMPQKQLEILVSEKNLETSNMIGSAIEIKIPNTPSQLDFSMAGATMGRSTVIASTLPTIPKGPPITSSQLTNSTEGGTTDKSTAIRPATPINSCQIDDPTNDIIRVNEEIASNYDFEFFVSSVINDRKSKFITLVASCSKYEMQHVMEKLKSNKMLKDATHKVVVTWFEDTFYNMMEDDGEPGAANHVLNKIKSLGVNNVVVISARWFGGIHLSSDRFIRYTESVEKALRMGNLVSEINMINTRSLPWAKRDIFLVGDSTLRNINKHSLIANNSVSMKACGTLEEAIDCMINTRERRKHIVFSVGNNDVKTDNEAHIIDQYETLVQISKEKHPGATLHLCSLVNKINLNKSNNVNKHLQLLARGDSRIKYVNMSDAELKADRIHPSENGVFTFETNICQSISNRPSIAKKQFTQQEFQKQTNSYYHAYGKTTPPNSKPTVTSNAVTNRNEIPLQTNLTPNSTESMCFSQTSPTPLVNPQQPSNINPYFPTPTMDGTLPNMNPYTIPRSYISPMAYNNSNSTNYSNALPQYCFQYNNPWPGAYPPQNQGLVYV